MPTLTPVDYDPFGSDKPSRSASGPRLTPVSGDPFKLSRPTPTTTPTETPTTQRPQPSSGLLRRTVGDTAVDLGRGIIGVGEAAVGLANIPTFGYAGKGLEAVGYRPAETKEMIGSLYSPERQEANREVEQAEGFVGTAKAMLRRPSTIAGAVAESAPSILGGGAIARGLGAVGKLSRPVRAAIGEGAVGAGGAAEGIRQETEDGTLSGKQVAAALGTGATTALLGYGGGRLAQRLGIGDVDTVLAGAGRNAIRGPTKTPGLARRTLQGAATEGVLEEMPQSATEQMWQNLALDRPLTEGVPESAAAGMLTGTAIGGPFAALSRPRPTVEPAPDIPDDITGARARALERMTPQQREEMVASDAASAARPEGNLTDTLRQQQEGQLLADIEAAETPEDRAAAEARLAEFQAQVAAWEALNGNVVDGGAAPVAPAGPGIKAAGEAVPGGDPQRNLGDDAGAQGFVAGVQTDLAGAGSAADTQPALSPGQLFPRAAPRLPDGSPVPDPSAGPLSRAVNEGVASGAVPTTQQAPMAEPMPEPVAEQPRPSADTGLMPGVLMEPLGEKGLLVHGDVAAIRERLAEAGFRKKGSNQNGALRFSAKDRDELEAALAQDAVPQPSSQSGLLAPPARGEMMAAESPGDVAGQTPVTMQNRDRSRVASVGQMHSIRNSPDPERLGFSRDPNTGAPMVGEGRAIPDADKGASDVVIGSDGRRVPVRYAVVEAGDLAASHDVDGRVNPEYASAPLKALNNGRVAGIQAAWKHGNGDAYKAGLIADARMHGVSPEAIQGKQNPVLVRLYDPAENRNDMGAWSNTGAQLEMSPVERAQTDARALPPLEAIEWAEDGSLPPVANANFFRSWFKNMGAAQAAGLQDAQGRPNAAALQRVRAALVQRAYGDERLLTALAEEVNQDHRNVMHALVRAAPAFAALDQNDAVAQDIRARVTEALEVLRQAVQRGVPLEAALAQIDMLGRAPEADAIAGFLGRNARSVRRMADAIRAMAIYASDAQSQAATTDIFGNASVSSVRGAIEAANHALREEHGEQYRIELPAEHDTGTAEPRDRNGERAAGERSAVEEAGRTGAVPEGEGSARQGQPGILTLSAPASAPAASTTPAPAQDGLFAPPTRREELDAEIARRDAARNGQTATGRTDMMAGDGELFAGPRPEQADIESAAAPTESGQSAGPVQAGIEQQATAYDAMPLETMRAMGRVRGIKNAGRMQRDRLSSELSALDRADEISRANQEGAVAQWRESVADLKGKQPWEMTRDEWARARSIVEQAVAAEEGANVAGVRSAQAAFRDFFGYSDSPNGNARHDLAVFDALEAGHPVPESVRAEYRGDNSYMRSDRERFQELLGPAPSAQGRESASAENARERITPDTAAEMRSGDIVVDEQGNEYRAHSARHDWLEAHPIINGRADVSADSRVVFLLTPSKADVYPERRNVPIYATGRNISDQPDAPNKGKPSATGAAAGTIEGQDALFDRLRDGAATLDDYKAGWSALQESRVALLEQLGKMTKEKLVELAGVRYRNDRKDRIAKAAFDQMETRYALGRAITWSMGQGGSSDAIARLVGSATQETIDTYAKDVADARAARTARVEGAKDPKTLAEFEDAVRLLGGESKLAPEQRARFDALRTEARREQREAEAKRNATVQRVSTGDTGMTLVETKHTQKGHDLFVVRLDAKVERDVYDRLNTAAKRLGGYYSSFRGNGAVPGFQFATRDAAQQFMALRDGNVDASAQQQAKADAKAEARAETLAGKAAALRERAQESLNRDRKANTARRAAQAASAEADARALLAVADTMDRISQAIESGKARMLSFIRHRSQVETLDQMLKALHWNHLRDKGVDWEKAKDAPIAENSITAATLPPFHVARDEAAKLAAVLQGKRGGKQLGDAIAEKIDYADEYAEAVRKEPGKFILHLSGGELALFKTKREADAAVKNAKSVPAAVVKLESPIDGSQWAAAMTPEAAIERKRWLPNYDKKIALSANAAQKIVDLAGTGYGSGVPYWWKTALDQRAMLAKLGIETNYEFREALREYLSMREAPKAEDRVRKLERDLVGRKDVGVDFFPTPPAVVQRLIEQADIGPGMRVLEPSAGKGDIAEAMRAAAENLTVDTVEMSSTLRDILEAKGFDTIAHDFLDMPAEPVYDRIVMNPPFGNDNGAAHVRHAYDMLNPGGRLVAVMGAGTRGKAEFDAWLETVGGLAEPLPEGSFKSSFRPTGVATQVVVIDKDGDAIPQPTQHNRAAEEIRNPLSVQEVESAIAGIRLSSRAGLARNGVEIIVVPDYSRFPPGPDGKPHTFTAGYIPETNTIAIVAMRVGSPESARKALLHEMVGHFGLNLFPPQVKQRILEAINRTRDGKALAGVWNEVKQLYADKGQIEQAEEVFARIAEDTPSGVRLWWDRFLSKWVLPALRALGLTGDTITRTDLRMLAADIAQGIREGAAQRTNADGSMREQRVWHGTPHRGIEQVGFKLNKIGTGEGAQAYGWGMYFAGRREAAEWYRKNLTRGPERYFYDGELAFERDASGAMFDLTDPRTAAIFHVANDGLAGAKKYLAGQGEWGKSAIDALKSLDPKKIRVERNEGQLYHAEIPDDSDLLDWDKPLSEQPEKVKAALAPLIEQVRDTKRFSDDPTGERIYNALSVRLAEGEAPGKLGRGAKAASEALLRAGIPGLRYLDGNSRDSKGGTHNYVIWDESLLTPEAAEITPYYSRPENNKSSFLTSAVDVQAAVRQVLDTWKGDKPVVRVVQTVAEARARGAKLPADAQTDFEGWWDGNATVWIVAGNNRDVSRALEVLSHEAIGHYGIERIMEGKDWARLVADVKRLRGLKQSDVSPKIWRVLQSAKRRYGQENDMGFAKEFLAIMAEQGVRSGLTSRVAAAIRQFLAKLGIPVNISKTFRESELLAALHAGRKQVVQGERGARHPSGRQPARAMAFSRQAANFDQPNQYDFNESDYRPSVVGWAKERFGDTVAPNGRPVWQNFVRWFGDSKVVDESGEPMVVYRGGPTEDWQSGAEITEFRSSNGPWAGFFTNSSETASRFANAQYALTRHGGKPVGVFPVYLSMQKPLEVDAGGKPARDFQIDASVLGKQDHPLRERMLNGDYDGLILRNTEDEGDVFVPLNPEQIKSATGNAGTFDPTNPDIRFSRPDSTARNGVEYAHGQEALTSWLASWSSALRLGGSRPRPVESRPESIGAVNRNASGAAEQGDATREEIREQSQRLIERAKADGFFWPDNSPIIADLGSLQSLGGAEHQVFLVGKGDSRFVIRATDNGSFGPRSDISPAQYLARLDDYSSTFPNLQTRLIGVSESAEVEGNAVIWTAQPYVRGTTFRNQPALAAAMRAHGWEQVGDDQSFQFRHTETGAVIEDAHTDNVFQDDNGDLYPFDVVVEALPSGGRYSRPDTITQAPPTGGVSVSERLAGAVRNTLGAVAKKTGRGQAKRPDWVSESVAGKFDTFSGKKPTKQWLDELKENAGLRLAQRIFDQYRSMRNYSEEGFMQAHLSRATDGTLEAVLNNGIPILKDGAYYVDEKNGGLKGLLSRLGGVEEAQRFFMWIAGNRSDRLASEGRENLFTPEDIKEMKAYNAGKLADGRNRKQAYDQALREFNRFQRAILDIAERAGEISPESRALWQSEFYIPFYRVAEETGQPFSPGNAGLVRQNVVKKLKGGTEKLGDPLENVLSNWSAMLSASMRNMAANKTLNEAVRLGAAERVPAGTKGATWTMVDGKQQHWMVHDKLLTESLEAMNFTGYNNPAMKLAGKFKRMLSVGVTVNPSYRIRNLTRDLVSALATANTGDVNAMNPLASLSALGKNIVRGAELTARDSNTNIQLTAGGGAVRFGLMNDGDQAANAKKLIAMGVNENQILDTPGKIKNAIRRAWDKYQELGDRAETINRAVIYDRAIKAGRSHLQASFEARDLMNFTSMGSSAAVRALAQVLPFFNARLQGLDKLGRAAKNDPRRFWPVAGHVAMASALLYMLQGDDDEYQALPDYVRDTYWPVKLGGTWVYIPKPFELGSLGTVVERGAELMMAGDDYQAKDFRDSMVSILTNTLAMNPVPQIIKPVGEAWFNYDTFRNAPIDSMAQQRLLPQDRFTARTSGAAVLAGQAVGVSPQKIEHMVKGYFGWLGIQALNVGDLLARDAAGLPSNPNRDMTSVNNWLVAGDFVKEAGSTPSKYLERFYESQKALDQIYATATQARRAGDTERALELLNDPTLRTRPAFQAADRRITRINQSIRSVTADRSLSAAEKNRRLENLRKQREEVAKRVDRLARAAG